MHRPFPTPIDLHPRCTHGSRVEQDPDGVWRLSIPAGPANQYRLAQLDDYTHLPRRKFTWQPPLAIELRARISQTDIKGTWGFGFWNDPFAISAGLKGAARRLPALPNTAWFFHASQPNYLTLHDKHPSEGFFAASFSSPLIPILLFAPALLFLPLLVWPVTARLLRKSARILVRESGGYLNIDPTVWHTYRLELRPDRVSFLIDGSTYHISTIIPRGQLGLVIWIDNQFAAFPPDGKLRFGTLETRGESWLEVSDLKIWNL